MKKVQEQIQELRKLTTPELESKLRDAKLKYQDLASQLAMGKVKTVAKLKELKKETARIATVKQEQAILTEVSNG